MTDQLPYETKGRNFCLTCAKECATDIVFYHKKKNVDFFSSKTDLEAGACFIHLRHLNATDKVAAAAVVACQLQQYLTTISFCFFLAFIQNQKTKKLFYAKMRKIIVNICKSLLLFFFERI